MEKAEVVVEPLMPWAELFVESEMPFPDAGGSVVLGLEESGSGRVADGGGGVVVGEANPFFCHLIDTRCLDLGRTVTSEVVVALVIDENENDIGWPFVSGELADQRNEKSDFEKAHIVDCLRGASMAEVGISIIERKADENREVGVARGEELVHVS